MWRRLGRYLFFMLLIFFSVSFFPSGIPRIKRARASLELDRMTLFRRAAPLQFTTLNRKIVHYICLCPFSTDNTVQAIATLLSVTLIVFFFVCLFVFDCLLSFVVFSVVTVGSGFLMSKKFHSLGVPVLVVGFTTLRIVFFRVVLRG